MKFIWCDTETTGLKPENSAPFEIAFIYVYTKDNKKYEGERLFHLNPLTEDILYHEESGAIHGFSKEKIESFLSAKEVVPCIVKFLQELTTCFETEDFEKLYFSGYNCQFDYDHLTKLFSDYGYNLNDYVYSKLIDVFKQVKTASNKKVLPYLENRKLGTVAKFLNINLENAHSALDDIKATREIAKSLQNQNVPLIELIEKKSV